MENLWENPNLPIFARKAPFLRGKGGFSGLRTFFPAAAAKPNHRFSKSFPQTARSAAAAKLFCSLWKICRFTEIFMDFLGKTIEISGQNPIFHKAHIPYYCYC
ncbi:MAG: hypothetical protein ACI4V1_06400 [Eubacteriales bacterium]